MKVDETSAGFVIARGLSDREQFFSFFVDHDSSCWTKYAREARIFDSKEAAIIALAELRRRVRERRTQPEPQEKET